MQETGNYQEYIFNSYKVYSNTDDTHFVYKSNINYEQFNKLFNIFNKQNIRYVQRDYKEYMYLDVIYQNYDNNEIKVFKLNPKKIELCDNILHITYDKMKLSLSNVPSNNSVNSISYVRTYIFRITNRIYVNFRIRKYIDNINTPDNELVYDIYINYNHDKLVDESIIEQQIKKIKNILTL